MGSKVPQEIPDHLKGVKPQVPPPPPPKKMGYFDVPKAFKDNHVRRLKEIESAVEANWEELERMTHLASIPEQERRVLGDIVGAFRAALNTPTSR